ncbi:MAG TPA: hypothetical protein VFZ34_33160, partial [Blastocatellia bacterium]|nr:hypothetical protein [Blastocatellia bacterium]
MFHDPALILKCDLPMGWCPDAESSLFRMVFRPWNRLDERVILTIVPTAKEPTADDEIWAEAVANSLLFGDDVEWLDFSAGTSITTVCTMAGGSPFRRVVVRGPVFDVVADQVDSLDESEELSPTLLRIVTSVRAPLRPPSLDTTVISLQEAQEAIAALSKESDAESYLQAYRRLESAAEEKWLRSLWQVAQEPVDLEALDALLHARIALGQHPAFVLTLGQAHAMLLRAVPFQAPTEPNLPFDESLRPALAALGNRWFRWVAAALRKRADLQQYQAVPDDIFGSDMFLQMMIGVLLIEDVRAAFQQEHRVYPAAAYEGVLAQSYALGGKGIDYYAADQSAALAEGLLLLGRAVTAYVETLQHEDDRDSVVEAAQYLTEMGQQLYELAANVPSAADLYRREGATYVATGLANQASALVKTADEASLEEALELSEQAHKWLSNAPQAYVDKTNISSCEALASLQLGDVARARRAALRGIGAAEHINDSNQLRVFEWILKTAEIIGKEPQRVRSLPELQFAQITATQGEDASLRNLCATLEQEMAD